MSTEAQEWNARYASEGRLWSGKVNALLRREIEDMKPGTVLDVGAGEGADAIWLAQQGWQVSAVDISQIAIDRAETAAHKASVKVQWIVADAREVSGEYDLVSAFYPVIQKNSDLFRHLCSLVKPGGTLLFVHHMPDPDKPRGHGPDFSKVMSAREALENLSPKWTIEKYEVIERGANSKHPYDELVRARKLA
ncbi:MULTISPECIES: class I SAM-dependent methyltransferase [Trueperella]|nr:MULTISPECIES: class I SAM-dependent methyltransferase [Trueperella]MCM3907221.1 class I SAM-dependent methyltransferase [Trueperella bernardiae]WIM08199.1 class I SAM-dependent methyltransferase [Trueperella bernardiae]